ncbi:MAG: beta-N-acetylhexosaminidase [Salinibacterium sp.]|nr:beta-N-acetylhexosaminidase [Salinibacterium sp.]
MASVIPAPVLHLEGDGSFDLTSTSTVGGEPAVAAYLSDVLGLELGNAHPAIELVIGVAPSPGGYTLDVSATGIRIEADTPAALFAGAQTLRQLLPPDQFVGVTTATVPATHIEDYPRFAYRGAMLDVARHFFTVEQVKRYIDDIALLKLNHLHLHLTDDQGWRLAIESWPGLTGIGASTQVNGGGGGFYTQQDYADLVTYAASRFITIVPEIDMPGHTNAAISAYPELGDGAVEPYEGIEVGFSSFAIRSEHTYEFIDDVVREVAALTPGPYLHLGGDESLATTDEDFRYFIGRATAIAAKHGKTLIGWHEMGRSDALPTGTIGQYWSFTTPQEGAAEHTLSFVRQGGRVIMSPADVAYLDIKYDTQSPLGLVWAEGPTSTRSSYGWDPAAIVPGLGEAQLLGVEAPLWTETIVTMEDVESMAFPRIASVAEIGWSAADRPRDWSEFAERLNGFGARLDAAGIRHTPVPPSDAP